MSLQAASGRPTLGRRAARMLRVLRAVDDRVEDEALMTAVAVRADRDAFGRLFGRYAPKVKAHLVARGAPAGVADELTQEVMLIVWRKAALFDAGKGSLVTWLYTISRNCLLNHMRRRAGGRSTSTSPEPGDAPDDARTRVNSSSSTASAGAGWRRRSSGFRPSNVRSCIAPTGRVRRCKNAPTRSRFRWGP